jgi:hypothetical protein
MFEQFARCRFGEVGAVQQNFPAGRLVQLRHRPRGCGLSAAGLPDQAEGLTAADREINAVDGADMPGCAFEYNPFFDRKVDAQVAHVQERLVVGSVIV